MKNLLILFIGCFLLFQGSDLFAQTKGVVKIESYFNMDTTLGVIFCGKLNYKVYHAALQGKIPVYRTSNLKPEEKFDKEDIPFVGGAVKPISYSDAEINDLDTEPYYRFKVQDIAGYYFSINWQLDSSGYSYSGTPEVFSFAYKDTNKGRNFIVPLFWMSINDLKILITPVEFHQLQEAIFLHLYAKIWSGYNRVKYPQDSKETKTEEIKTYSHQTYYFNTRLSAGLDPLKLKQMNLKLYNDAINGKMAVYENDSMLLGSAMPKETIQLKGTHEYFTANQDSHRRDTLIIEPFNTDSIIGNSVNELWEMDYKNNKIIGRITGIDVDYNFHLPWINFGRYCLFCVPYKDVEAIIGRVELLKMSNILFNSLVKGF